MRRAALLGIVAAALLAGCGGGGDTSSDDPLSYDDGAPLALQERTRSGRDGIVVQDVSFESGDDRVEGYLVSRRRPPGSSPRSCSSTAPAAAETSSSERR